MSISWQELAAEKRRRQTASIPKEWLITTPADDVLDVTDVPAKCGLLSARELEITTISDVTALLHKLATGEWSSVEVTTAFSKRAIIAHQVVCPLSSLPSQATLLSSLCIRATSRSRRTALQRYSLTAPSRELRGSMSNSSRLGRSLARFMVSQSRSKTNYASKDWRQSWVREFCICQRSPGTHFGRSRLCLVGRQSCRA
jgi:hypothetical protein